MSASPSACKRLGATMFKPVTGKKKPLHRLTVRWTVAASSAHRRANDDGTARLIVVHLPKFRGVVDDLIGAQRDEIAEHDFDDGTQTAQRHPAR